MTTTVNDIGTSIAILYPVFPSRALYFQPPTPKWSGALAGTSIAQTLLRIFPPGTTPPSIIKYDARSVPILNWGWRAKR